MSMRGSLRCMRGRAAVAMPDALVAPRTSRPTWTCIAEALKTTDGSHKRGRGSDQVGRTWRCVSIADSDGASDRSCRHRRFRTRRGAGRRRPRPRVAISLRNAIRFSPHDLVRIARLDAPVAQLDRAAASGAAGHGFESPRAYQHKLACVRELRRGPRARDLGRHVACASLVP